MVGVVVEGVGASTSRCAARNGQIGKFPNGQIKTMSQEVPQNRLEFMQRSLWKCYAALMVVWLFVRVEPEQGWMSTGVMVFYRALMTPALSLLVLSNDGLLSAICTLSLGAIYIGCAIAMVVSTVAILRRKIAPIPAALLCLVVLSFQVVIAVWHAIELRNAPWRLAGFQSTRSISNSNKISLYMVDGVYGLLWIALFAVCLYVLWNWKKYKADSESRGTGNVCRWCGYGFPGDVCPECGKPREKNTEALRASTRWQTIGLGIGVAIGGAALPCVPKIVEQSRSLDIAWPLMVIWGQVIAWQLSATILWRDHLITHLKRWMAFALCIYGLNGLLAIGAVIAMLNNATA